VEKFELVSSGGRTDHCKKAVGQLIVSGSDGADDPELSKHALDAIGLLVERTILLDFDVAVRAARNDGLDIRLGKVGADCVGIVALVGAQSVMCRLGQAHHGVFQSKKCGFHLLSYSKPLFAKCPCDQSLKTDILSGLPTRG
jgi:hypothetical protein